MSAYRLLKKEQSVIDALHRIAKRWPKSLWLFSASGTLCVMRNKPDGSRGITRFGSYDQDFAIDSIDISNDGGDW